MPVSHNESVLSKKTTLHLSSADIYGDSDIKITYGCNQETYMKILLNLLIKKPLFKLQYEVKIYEKIKFENPILYIATTNENDVGQFLTQ